MAQAVRDIKLYSAFCPSILFVLLYFVCEIKIYILPTQPYSGDSIPPPPLKVMDADPILKKSL